MKSSSESISNKKRNSQKLSQIKFRFESIPLLGTRGYDDLRWLILLLPIWWILGVEQFVWPVLLLWSFIKILVRKKFTVYVSPLAVAFGLFLASQLFSAIFISSSIRYISFIRSFSTFFSILLLFLIVQNSNLSNEESGKLIDSLLISIGVAGLFGVLAEIGIFRPHIKSMISYILPSGITNTSYGSVIAIKSLGNPSWFSGLGNYYRLSSLFLYPTLYGSALAYTTPIAFYRLSFPSRIWTRSRSLILIAVLLLNLIFTTGRTALLSLIIGGVLFMWFFSDKKHNYRIMIIFVGILCLVSFIGISVISSGVFDTIEQGIQSFLYARGEGTVVSRFSIYKYTLQDLVQRPFWGWGTERDIESIKLPLGSHSFYLALLYRFGVIGFGIYLFIIGKTWFNVNRYKYTALLNSDERGLSTFVLWTLVVGLLDGLFTVPLLDINTLLFFWFAVVLTMPKNKER